MAHFILNAQQPGQTNEEERRNRERKKEREKKVKRDKKIARGGFLLNLLRPSSKKKGTSKDPPDTRASLEA